MFSRKDTKKESVHESDENIISLSNVSKSFYRETQHEQSALVFLKKVFCLESTVVPDRRQVLQDINLKLNKGERLGVIGRNGTGKSTLLRLVASIYQPDEGDIRVVGSVAYISGFSQGIRPRLSGMDNLRVLGALYGVPNAQVEKMKASIIEFAELKDFEAEKIFTYSDGMRARLAFSACMHFIEYNNPEIILLDEVFSGGGDSMFQEKAKKRLDNFMLKGKTVIFVSHSMDQVKRFCTRVIVLKNMTVVCDSDPITATTFFQNNL